MRESETAIVLPWPPKELSPNARLHWAKKSGIASKYRAACAWLTMASKVKPGEERPITLKVTFLAPDKRHRDDDNVIASWKAGRDGVADAWGVDDKHFAVAYCCGGEPVKGGQVKVEILM